MSGIETSERDPAIHPGDDLYLHMNGRWLESSTIPADKARYGAFTLLAEEAEQAVLAIIKESASAAEGSPARKVGDLYASFMDEQHIESVGLEPLRVLLEEIAGAAGAGHHHLATTLGGLERKGVGGLWQLFVDNDPGDPEQYVIFFEQGGISLPDEAYYRSEDHAQVREAFASHLERVFSLVGLDQGGQRAARVMAVETLIASHHWDNVKCRDAEATYNKWDGDHLTKTLDAFPFEDWRRSAGIEPHVFAELVVRQPEFVHSLGEAWSTLSAEDIRDWMMWNTIRAFSPYLTQDLAHANFDFFGTTLSGTLEMRKRWKRGVSFVESVMGQAVGELYVAKHFPPEHKAQMEELVTTLLDAYRDSIHSLGWMSAATKEKALEKLDSFVPKIGYPDVWRDYSTLVVTPGDLLANVQAGNEFDFALELGKIGAPLDRAEWFMTPQTVNAYYNPGFNEIVFPAAILRYPFFDPHRDAAANYGAIGAVIGHEIGHGFDDQGSRFDGSGRLHNWWSDEDRAAFEERTGNLITQFNALSPRGLAGHTVNGELTIGENIGDLGGLAIAWKAYLLSLRGDDLPELDDMSGAQRFFLSWAQSWKLAVRQEEALRLLAIDPHSPPEFRCNQIVRNLDVFYEAFEVGEDHALWLEPEKRVSIW
ncbi:MAG: putative endopeptidase [Pontimonas sp.]|jgi:putative endopeptidase